MNRDYSVKTQTLICTDPLVKAVFSITALHVTEFGIFYYYVGANVPWLLALGIMKLSECL